MYTDMHSQVVLTPDDPRPLYLQVRQRIERLIARGDWVAGEQIPSMRTLAVALGVSVITIKRAYLELERDGLIVTRQGKGSFVAVRPAAAPALQAAEVDAHLLAALEAASAAGMSRAQLEERLRSLARKGS